MLYSLHLWYAFEEGTCIGQPTKNAGILKLKIKKTLWCLINMETRVSSKCCLRHIVVAPLLKTWTSSSKSIHVCLRSHGHSIERYGLPHDALGMGGHVTVRWGRNTLVEGRTLVHQQILAIIVPEGGFHSPPNTYLVTRNVVLDYKNYPTIYESYISLITQGN